MFIASAVSRGRGGNYVPPISTGQSIFTVSGIQAGFSNGVNSLEPFYNGKLRYSHSPVLPPGGYGSRSYAGKTWNRFAVDREPVFTGNQYRAEIETWPYPSQYPLGTEEWFGATYCIPAEDDGKVIVQSPFQQTIFQSQQGSMPGSESNPPAIDLSIAYPGQLNSSTPWRKTPLGGEIMIAMESRIQGGVVYRWTPQDSVVRLYPGGPPVKIVIKIIHGLGGNGEFKIWFNDVHYPNPSFTTSGQTFAGGDVGQTVRPEVYDTTTMQVRCGNLKRGLYHPGLRYENVWEDMGNVGHTRGVILMSDQYHLVRLPSDANYGDDTTGYALADPGDEWLQPELSPARMEYGQYSSEWYIAVLPEGHDESAENFIPTYWWNGDGGDGNPTLVQGKVMNGTGPSYSMPYANGSQEVAWGSIVVKVGSAEVARGQSDGTIKGPGVTGTTNHLQANGTLWVHFESTPASTPTVDYLYSPVFEAGLPRMVNRGDTLDGRIVLFIVHKAANNTNYLVIEHYEHVRNYLEPLYKVDTNRRIAAGLSRGGIMVRTVLINKHTEFAGFIMAPTDISGTIPWASLYDRGQMWISGQADVTTAPPNANYMNAIGGSHPGFRFFPSFTLLNDIGHWPEIWNDAAFDRNTAPWDWVRWARLWNLDINLQCEQHVEVAEETLSIDDYRAARRAVSFLSAGATKTALEARLVTLKNNIDAGRRRWYVDAGSVAPTTPNINQAANFNTGQTYNNLIDDNGNASTVGFRIGSQLIGSGTNRVSTENRTGVAGFGYAYEEYFDFAQVGNINGSIEWLGLDSGKTYRVTLYAAGGNGTVTNDINIAATVGGQTKSIFTQLTNTRKLEWTGVVPNGSNEIVISNINNNGVTIGAGIQVFMLEEEN